MSDKKRKTKQAREITEVTMVEKELLLNSMTQQELLKTTKDLNKTIKELTKTLKILEHHEYLEIHKSKWKIVAYNILLGVLFAFGTVFGLVLLSWLTFNFFKDSVILKGIVENQLKIRQLDVRQMQDRIKQDIKHDLGKEAKTQSGSIIESTGSGK